MDGSWSAPTTSWTGPDEAAKPKSAKRKPRKTVPKITDPLVEEEKYHALIVDSGAIIKHTGYSRLHNSATRYITTQGVIDEIRDGKARNHLESLPFELEVREPTAEGLAKMVEFAKKTGDYASLSAVDMHILALLYDLEKEGCKSVKHIRTEPKRALTGKVTAMNKNAVRDNDESTIATDGGASINSEDVSVGDLPMEVGASFFQGKIQVPVEEMEVVEEEDEAPVAAPVKKGWATLVNPPAAVVKRATPIATMDMTANFGSMNLVSSAKEEDLGGQFSDAEDDDSSWEPADDDEFDSSDDESSDDDDEDESSDDEGAEYASIGDDFSDEECDVYILDPEEVEERKKQMQDAVAAYAAEASEPQSLPEIAPTSEVEELEMEFPSLSAAATVPYEGSDNEEEKDTVGNEEKLKKAEEERAKYREASLQPISSSGKLYNSFRGYKDIVVPAGVNIQPKKKYGDVSEKKVAFNFATEEKEENAKEARPKVLNSRIMGFSGQSAEVDDDGEGWVTSTKEIASMKAMGTLDPFNGGSGRNQMMKLDANLPAKSCRAACATTDFAMQNVILQMNLELLSVDGVKVRRLKSWVTRCAACFKVYTGSENDGKRLFCAKCGSASLQRIAASVDGKTGRLKLHLKKNFKSRTRGTQFALPKAGTQNKYMGDLLLAEDQLMYGAWNQRLRMGRSKKEKQSIFGTELAATVGVHQDLTKRDDIKVGFGRKNPNASKFGRERRGKKKKHADKACALRRY